LPPSNCASQSGKLNLKSSQQRLQPQMQPQQQQQPSQQQKLQLQKKLSQAGDEFAHAAALVQPRQPGNAFAHAALL